MARSLSGKPLGIAYGVIVRIGRVRLVAPKLLRCGGIKARHFASYAFANASLNRCGNPSAGRWARPANISP